MNNSDIVQVLLAGQQLLASQQQRVAATQLFEQVRIGREGSGLRCSQAVRRLCLCRRRRRALDSALGRRAARGCN